MKKILTGCLFFAVALLTKAQDVSNVRAYQENGKAVIVYDLLSIDPAKEFYVKIFCSTDGGKTYGTMLTQATGDINTMVKPGQSKTAVWDVLKESSSAKGEFTFKVDAVSVGSNGVLPSIESKGTLVQLLDVSKVGNDVTVIASFTNKTTAAIQIICANFLIVDDNDKICRDVTGDVNKLIVLNALERKTVSFIVKNVSPTSKGFSQFDFNASSIAVRFKSVPYLN